MGTERKRVVSHVERKTFIQGRFCGQFSGRLDPISSRLGVESFFDLEICNGTIDATEGQVRQFYEGEPEDFIKEEEFLVRFPRLLACKFKSADHQTRYYKLNIYNPKLKNFHLSNQIYEGDMVFGDIEGEISCCIIHYDEEVNFVDVPSESLNANESIFKTTRLTGRRQKIGAFERQQYFYSDNSTYWGSWNRTGEVHRSYTIWEGLAWLIRMVVFGLLLVSFINASWQFILYLLLLGAIVMVATLCQVVIVSLGRYILRIGGVVLLGLIIYSVITADRSRGANRTLEDITEETRSLEVSNSYRTDSVVSNFRVWEDYQKEEYRGFVEVRKKDVEMSENHRVSQPIVASPESYDLLLDGMHAFNQPKLDRLIQMFDSLRRYRSLDKMRLAETITCCVQDIPYALVLPGKCDASQYSEQFVRDYLNQGGECVGGVKFGVFAPTEFAANLKGDCDTRTTLLYSILDHFGYDVAIFTSEIYGHSLLGINLPYSGSSKTVNGVRYVLWETTAPGFPPGLISNEFNDMRFWRPSLMNNPFQV